MKDYSAALSYARALYQALSDKNAADQLESAIVDFARLVAQMQSVAPLWQRLCSASVSSTSKKEALHLFYSAAQIQPQITVKNFLDLIVYQKRFHLLPSIVERLKEEALTGAGKVCAKISSALPLNTQQLQNIERSLNTRFKKNIVSQTHVDPSLLAGTVVQVGDCVIDNSLKARLKKLENSLKLSALTI